MNLIFKEGQEVTGLLVQNRQTFEEQLLSEAKNVRDKIEQI